MINDLKQSEYTADDVIKRAYAIYDEWTTKKSASRKIVSYVEVAVSYVKQNKETTAVLDALACLFALDKRIKEKYSNIIRCLILYFSWRRETHALKHLKNTFNISDSIDDIRTAIEVELQRIREKIKEESDEGDDEAHGGKRNGKTNIEELAQREKGEENPGVEASEESSSKEDKKEDVEEKTEKAAKETTVNDSEKNDEQKENTESPETKNEDKIRDEKALHKNEGDTQLKEEKDGKLEKSAPRTDKAQDSKAYNDAIDSTPIHEKSSSEKSSENKSFIDDVIIDNMVKGKEDIVGHNPLEEAKQVRDVNRTEDYVMQNRDENKSTDKNAYLYDKMVMSDKGGAHPAAKIAETKSTQVGASAQSSKETVKVSDVKDLRVPLQVDITIDQENDMRRDISDNMSEEAIKAIYEQQASAMREQLNIASAELGMDAPVEIIGRPETAPPEQSVTGPNRK